MTFPHFSGASRGPKKTRIWRCGDDSRCPPIPQPDETPWDTCLKPLMQEDRQQCEAWREEIQNLLIFSGLFSAVVTAFVVQTYEDLQPSSQQYTPLLLARLIQLQNTSNDTLLETVLSMNADMTPSTSVIRTNICWFSSLVLSLIVVLVGTVSLQWLREFQRYPPSLSSKKLFAARNLRAESFEGWWAPQIIAGLPQLLQLAVILFFLGLMDSLLQLNMVVALPVVVLGVLAVCFQAITTILPTIQSFWLINKAGFSKPPLHCPYKSPQSWAFLRFVTSNLFRTGLNWIGCMSVQLFLIPLAPIMMYSQVAGFDTLLWKFIDRFSVSLHLKYLSTINNWDEFDDLWLQERHRSATGTSRGSHNHFHKCTTATDYDAARGIARIMGSRVVAGPMAMAIYHCFQKLDPVVITDNLLRLMTQGLPPWLFTREGSRKGHHLNPPNTAMIKEENEMFFLSRLPQTIYIGTPLHVFRLRQLELFVRTTAHMLVRCNWDDTGLNRDSLTVRPLEEIGTDAGPLFVPPLLKDVKAMKHIPRDFALDIAEQLIKIFEAYVTSVLREDGEAADIDLSIAETEPVLGEFMDVVHVVSLFLAFDANSTGRDIVLITDLALVLDQMAARLTYLLTRSLPAPRLLRCAKLYASRFHFTDWIPLQRRAPLFSASLEALIRIISFYSSEHGDYQFTHLPAQFRMQWGQLRHEVLRHQTLVKPPTPSRSILDTDTEHWLDIDVTDVTYPSTNSSSSTSSRSWTHSVEGIAITPAADHIFESAAISPEAPLSTLNWDQDRLIPPHGVHSISRSSASRHFTSYSSSTTLRDSGQPLDSTGYLPANSIPIKTYEIV